MAAVTIMLVTTRPARRGRNYLLEHSMAESRTPSCITKGCTRSTHSGGCEVVSFSFVPGEPRRYPSGGSARRHAETSTEFSRYLGLNCAVLGSGIGSVLNRQTFASNGQHERRNAQPTTRLFGFVVRSPFCPLPTLGRLLGETDWSNSRWHNPFRNRTSQTNAMLTTMDAFHGSLRAVLLLHLLASIRCAVAPALRNPCS